jgi:hypothetical protein
MTTLTLRENVEMGVHVVLVAVAAGAAVAAFFFPLIAVLWAFGALH